MQGWIMKSEIIEELRPPRLTRVGLVQHKIALPATHPILEQRDVIHKKIASYIIKAAQFNVQILCLQEAWRM